jgi:acyl carrier protein
MNQGSTMDRQALQAIVAEELLDIAPEAELATLDTGADLRVELELDSLDFLNLVIAVNQRLKIQIPESDYDQITTLTALLDYLERASQPT